MTKEFTIYNFTRSQQEWCLKTYYYIKIEVCIIYQGFLIRDIKLFKLQEKLIF